MYRDRSSSSACLGSSSRITISTLAPSSRQTDDSRGRQLRKPAAERHNPASGVHRRSGQSPVYPAAGGGGATASPYANPADCREGCNLGSRAIHRAPWLPEHSGAPTEAPRGLLPDTQFPGRVRGAAGSVLPGPEQSFRAAGSAGGPDDSAPNTFGHMVAVAGRFSPQVHPAAGCRNFLGIERNNEFRRVRISPVATWSAPCGAEILRITPSTGTTFRYDACGNMPASSDVTSRGVSAVRIPCRCHQRHRRRH